MAHGIGTDRKAAIIEDMRYSHLCAAFHSISCMTLVVFDENEIDQAVPVFRPGADLIALGHNQIAMLYANIEKDRNGVLNVKYLVTEIRSFTSAISLLSGQDLRHTLLRLNHEVKTSKSLVLN